MGYRTAYRIKKARREAVLNRQRRRAVIGLMAALLLGWLINSVPLSLGSIEAASSDAVFVTVQRGDSLWSLAGKYKPENKDMRKFVRAVADFNNMDGLMVYEGQTLMIPQ